MGRVIGAAELQSHWTPGLARWLLGKTLVRTRGKERLAGLITEVEAYHGESDLACHASKGRTPRTDVLYSAGGVWYVYLVYGMHHMLNLVTGPENHPAAVLIRGIESHSGPGRLTKALEIDLSLNRAPADPASGLHLEDDGVSLPRRRVRATPRIGIDYAGPIWAAKPWRFHLEPKFQSGETLARSATLSERNAPAFRRSGIWPPEARVQRAKAGSRNQRP